MKMRSRVACLMLALGGMAVVPATAQVAPPPRTLSPVQQAIKQQQDAEAALKSAQAAVTRAHDKVKATYLLKPEWAPVNAQLAKAETDEKNLHRTVFAAVHARPEYAALVQKKEAAEKIQRTAQAGYKPGSDDVKISDEELAAAYQDSLKASVEMKAMEQQALSNDQAYLDAAARVDGGKAKLAQLDAEVDDSLKDNTEYIALKAAVDQAQVQLETARQALVTARQQPAQQPGQPRPVTPRQPPRPRP